METEREWEKEFDEKFKCIQGECDGTGCIPNQVAEGEWEAQQCQFHAEYIFPLKSFIASAIAQARLEERQRVVETYTEFLLKNNYCDADVYAEQPSAIERYLSAQSSPE